MCKYIVKAKKREVNFMREDMINGQFVNIFY